MEHFAFYFVLCFYLGIHFHKSVCSEVKLTSSPGTITSGLTDTLTLRCSLQDTTGAAGVIFGRQVSTTSYDIEHVNSIIVSKVNPNETVTSLAQIITSETASVLGGSQTLTAVGTVSPSDPADPEYLQLTWKYPGADQSGNYVCEVNGLDLQGHSVMLQQSISVDVVDPDVSDLVQEINNLKTIVETLKPPHSESGVARCGDSNTWTVLPSGIKQSQQTVTFKQPYTSPPVIYVSLMGAGIRDSEVETFFLKCKDVTTTGFTVICDLWSDSHYTEMDVGWMSLVA